MVSPPPPKPIPPTVTAADLKDPTKRDAVFTDAVALRSSLTPEEQAKNLAVLKQTNQALDQVEKTILAPLRKQRHEAYTPDVKDLKELPGRIQKHADAITFFKSDPTKPWTPKEEADWGGWQQRDQQQLTALQNNPAVVQQAAQYDALVAQYAQADLVNAAPLRTQQEQTIQTLGVLDPPQYDSVGIGVESWFSINTNLRFLARSYGLPS
jgi:hypothetical protein